MEGSGEIIVDEKLKAIDKRTGRYINVIARTIDNGTSFPIVKYLDKNRKELNYDCVRHLNFDIDIDWELRRYQIVKDLLSNDFDGTCVTDLYPYVGDNIGAASVLRELGDKNLLILYTVRDGKYLQDAVDWFRYNHINLYSVNYNPEPVSSSPKLYCDYYIDDRNIGTPLTDKGYVDWDKMLVLLRQNNLL